MVDKSQAERSNRFWRFDFWNTDMRAAVKEAESALEAAGFSVGRLQRDDPRGILFGDYDIQKWRNLRPRERAALHGKLLSKSYPVSAQFPSGLPDEVDDALQAMNVALVAQEKSHV